MATGFDLTAVARSLLDIEVNTIVRASMTGEPMPPAPHGLLDIASEYAQELCGLGVDLAQYFKPGAGDPETIDPGWANRPAEVSDELTVSPETFNRLRWAAKWAARAADRRPKPLPQAKRVLLERIINNSDAIKEMFKRFDAGFNTQFLNKNRSALVNITIRADSYVIPPADVILLQKIWDIGMEEIVVQTIVHVTGDVTTRVQEALAGARSELLFSIHRQSLDVSVGRWKDLLDAIRELAGTAVGVLLGRPK
jgi:hypothetical protein